MRFRLTIRLKIFLIIAGILISTAVLFQIISVSVFKSVVRNNIKKELVSVFKVCKKEFAEYADLKSFLQARDKHFGGFATVFSPDLNIIYTTSPRFHNPGKLSGELYFCIEDELSGAPEGYVTYDTLTVATSFNGEMPGEPDTGAPGIRPLPPDGLFPDPASLSSEDQPYMLFLTGRLDEDHLIFLEKPTDHIQAGIDYASSAVFITLLIVLISGLAAAVPISYIFTKPIYRIKKKAGAIAELDFQYKLDIRNRDELGELAATMNRISGKLETTLVELQASNEQLSRLSQTDALTGLANRLKIDSVLADEQYKAEHRGIPFSVIIIDIDHFKQVNDEYGHPEGDRILVMFAELIKKNSRRIDLAGRWGGEEFIVILPDTACEGGAAMAEKLRLIIENTDFGLSGSLTASFGTGEYTKGSELPGFINEVDQALYHAKNNGRNLVVRSDRS